MLHAVQLVVICIKNETLSGNQKTKEQGFAI